jgi:hypothetical protein
MGAKVQEISADVAPAIRARVIRRGVRNASN